jgi:hypothetical protein
VVTCAAMLGQPDASPMPELDGGRLELCSVSVIVVVTLTIISEVTVEAGRVISDVTVEAGSVMSSVLVIYEVTAGSVIFSVMYDVLAGSVE